MIICPPADSIFLREVLNPPPSMIGAEELARQLTDLIGSLCDLTSGSGDKGTPVVLVQGYFDNYPT